MQSEVSALSSARAALALEGDALQSEKQLLISAHDAKVEEVVSNKDKEIASLLANLDAANAQSKGDMQQLRGELAQKEQEVQRLLDSVLQARRGKPFATTRLNAAAIAGGRELECNVPAGCMPGMLVVIGEGHDHEEERHISGFASILIDHPLSHTHSVGTIVNIYDPDQLVLTSNLAAVTAELQEQRQQLAQVETQLREQTAEYQRYQDEADRTTLMTLAQHSAQVEDFQCLLARSYEERAKITADSVEYQRQLAIAQIASAEVSVVVEERDRLRGELERTKTSLAGVTSDFQTCQEQLIRSIGEAKMTQVREQHQLSIVSEQLRIEVEDLQRQIAIHNSEVDRLTAEREALQKEKDMMRRDTDAELQRLRVRLAEMTTSCATLQSEKQLLISLHDAKVKEVDGELSAMLVHLTEVTEEAAANEERVHDLTAKTYALEQIVSNKDKDLSTSLAALQQQLSAKEEELATQQRMQMAMAEEHQSYKLRVGEDMKSRDLDVKVLKGELSLLTTEAAAAQADLRLVQVQYDELLERFERMERLYTEALAENTILSRYYCHESRYYFRCASFDQRIYLPNAPIL